MKRLLYLPILVLTLGCSHVAEKDEPLKYNESGITKIDSLILTDVELPEVINYLQFDTATISVFRNLADETDGQLYLAANANLVVETIVEVLEDHGSDNIDVCFLIDKTGSMADDISLIQQSMDRIFGAIRAYKNVNVALAFYGDENVDGVFWIDIEDFSQDFEELEEDLRQITYSGGGDAPESVTDGAFEVINTLEWTSTKKRIILLLGDAPSHVPPMARYSVNDIIREAKAKDILMNFYPVVVGFAGTQVGPQDANLLTSVYPNPTKGVVNLLFENTTEHRVEVFSSSGKSIYSERVNTEKHQIDLSLQSDDVYVIRVFGDNNSSVDTRKIILRK